MKAKKNNEEIRIGVFVCHCGSNIGGLIDCAKLAEYASTLPNVNHSEDNLYTCSENGLTKIKEAIKEHDLNRVVVCSCTPRTHEPLFRETIEEAGLNKYLFNFVNIRDQCTWVHMGDAEAAYDKARDLIKMGVSKAEYLEPLENIIVKVNPSALVIGGGVSGMTAALNLNNQGYETYLIEKEDHLGGMLNNLYKLFPHDQDASSLLNEFNDKLDATNNLQIYTSSNVIDINGFVGNYEVTISHDGKNLNLSVGTIIVAVGASPFEPIGFYDYNGKTRISQLELEHLLKTHQVNANNIVMIQCVGARIEERKYCSNTCCMSAIKNALIMKERNPNANITILFRDLYTPGVEYENYYRQAREKGILFVKYNLEKEPIVKEKEIVVFNEYLGEEMSIPCDLVVLSTPLVASEDNEGLAKLLKVPLEENNFFLEAHVKLRPIDFATDGVYVCGSAKWPGDVSECISQGYAAASRATTILSHETLEVEGSIAFLPEWNKELCKGCEVCIKVCPYNAIKKNDDDEIEIIQALCKGCGVCGATCTKKAITIRHFTNEQIISEIYALGGREIT